MADKKTVSREPMLEMFIFETQQLLEQLEDILIESEKINLLSTESVNEVFRIMHTIKGAAAMMMYDSIASLTHAAEDIFAVIRQAAKPLSDISELADAVLQVSDFIKGEIVVIEDGGQPGALPGELAERLKVLLAHYASAKPATDKVSQPAQPVSAPQEASPHKACPPEQNTDAARFRARMFFEDGCQMENMRAFTVVHNLKPHVCELSYEPADIDVNENSSGQIRETGFSLTFCSEEDPEVLYALLDQTLFLERLEFEQDEPAMTRPADEPPGQQKGVPPTTQPETVVSTAAPVTSGRPQSIISINITKLDQLMDLVGELVIAEAMVTRSPDLDGLELDQFAKSARQLGKLTDELQDIAMSIRMVPVAPTFSKMQRIIRDMNRKLGKSVELVTAGEETEIDKSIIDRLSDPLMHLIRNSLDHGIETPEARRKAGKPDKGTVRLEAKNSGGDVWITIRDDGKGLDRDKILDKARRQNLLKKPAEDYTDKEIYSFILLPGFSTKEEVSEFSGRGVGMDVVRENIEQVGGQISLDSQAGQGTTISIRIPLTLAILQGMHVKVGQTSFIIPTTTIRETFRAKPEQVIHDTEGHEMMMIRGECFSISRLHQHFNLEPKVESLTDGIIVVVEDSDRALCLFADELLGEQQVVVKPLPAYIKKAKSLAGCTILGDGSISLILDIRDLTENH